MRMDELAWLQYDFITREVPFEICIEPCLDGYDVAIYDQNLNLLEPKQCTNISIGTKVINVVKAQKKALKYANALYKKYNSLISRQQ